MTYEEALLWVQDRDCVICSRYSCEDCKMSEALSIAEKALELVADLTREIPTFKHIIAAEYEMFYMYDLKNHTELERLCFYEFGEIVQDLQWLVDELEGEDEQTTEKETDNLQI